MHKVIINDSTILIDDEDVDVFEKYKIGIDKVSKNHSYVIGRYILNGQRKKDIIGGVIGGRKGIVGRVGYKNGNTFDLRRGNLVPNKGRLRVTVPKNNTSGYVGVYRDKAGWRVAVTINDQYKHLGRYKTKIQAIKASKEFRENYNA